MAKASDILKELEDIGAIGGKIQAPQPRRVHVDPAPLVFNFEPTAPVQVEQAPSKSAASPERLNQFATGFAEQLGILETALQGMLDWCAQARADVLDTQEETEPNYDEVAEAGLATKLAELPAEPVEEVVSEPAPEVVAASEEEPEVAEPVAPPKPMLSVEEVKAKFILPGSMTEELANLRRPRNGAPSVTSSSVPTPELESPRG